MSWKMKCMDEKYLTKSLDLVERVFTESENAVILSGISRPYISFSSS